MNFIVNRLMGFLFFIFLSGMMFGQGGSPLHLWGKVDSKEREMTTYEPEPDVNAVILSDYCSVKFNLTNYGVKTVYVYHTKIKILSKEGFEQGDIILPYYADEGFEKIRKVKAHTINFEKGKSKITELKKSEFYDEDINEYYKAIKFTFPDLREGSVIEYQYEKESEGFVDIETWYFQGDLPTLWSEVRLGMPAIFEYTYVMHKKQDLIIETSYKNSFTWGNGEIAGTTYIFAHRNIPSIKEEPFITTMSDYRQKIDFQLSAILLPNEPVDSILTSWKKLGYDLSRYSLVGKQMSLRNNFKNLEKATLPLVESVEDQEAKVKVLYDYILKNIEWNGRMGVVASESIDEAFKSGQGNGAVLNYALIALLRQQGIEAWPVLISTRENGEVQKLYPIRTQFDHAIGYAMINEKPYFFDIRNKLRPSHLIAVECLNGIGFLLDGADSRWVDIESVVSKSFYNTTLQIENGVLSGTIKSHHTDYSALNIRGEVKEDGKNDYLSTIFEDSPAFNADSIVFENLEDPDYPLIQTVYLSSIEDEYDGDILYINPIIGENLTENPFKLDDRNYPVDMAYRYDETYVFNMNIPEGYAIDEMPESLKINLFSDAAVFEFLTTGNADFVQVKSHVKFDRAVFQPEEYKDLKSFFDRIVEKHAEQIVIKKLP